MRNTTDNNLPIEWNEPDYTITSVDGIREGDEVTVTELPDPYYEVDTGILGKIGVVTDLDDDSRPFRVEIDGRYHWVSRVSKLTEHEDLPVLLPYCRTPVQEAKENLITALEQTLRNAQEQVKRIEAQLEAVKKL